MTDEAYFDLLLNMNSRDVMKEALSKYEQKQWAWFWFLVGVAGARLRKEKDSYFNQAIINKTFACAHDPDPRFDDKRGDADTVSELFRKLIQGENDNAKRPN